MMQVLDSELDLDRDDEKEEGHEDGRAIVSGWRFTCDDYFRFAFIFALYSEAPRQNFIPPTPLSLQEGG